MFCLIDSNFLIGRPHLPSFRLLGIYPYLIINHGPHTVSLFSEWPPLRPGISGRIQQSHLSKPRWLPTIPPLHEILSCGGDEEARTWAVDTSISRWMHINFQNDILILYTTNLRNQNKVFRVFAQQILNVKIKYRRMNNMSLHEEIVNACTYGTGDNGTKTQP